MTKITIYDPALCCPTGVCGPSVDPELTRIASAVFLLEKKGIDIKRFNLANDPQAFAENEKVQELLKEKELEALPIVFLNDEVTKVGSYPTDEELEAWTGIDKQELTQKDKAKNKINLL